MTARPQDVALLPLPASSWQLFHDDAAGTEIAPPTPLWNADKMAAYARANVTAALASAQAREEELRAEVEMLRSQVRTAANFADTAQELHQHEKDRAERLAEALRELARWEEGDSIIRKIALDALAESTNAATQPGETNEAAE